MLLLSLSFYCSYALLAVLSLRLGNYISEFGGLFLKIHFHEQFFYRFCSHAYFITAFAVALCVLSFFIRTYDLLFIRSVLPGSRTTKLLKLSTCSRSFGLISRSSPILLGTPLKYHICDTGAASSMCPILSLRTLLFVTSTPHLSHITPLYLILLYLPQ